MMFPKQREKELTLCTFLDSFDLVLVNKLVHLFCTILLLHSCTFRMLIQLSEYIAKRFVSRLLTFPTVG